jgi:YHS domain-containing protein
MEQAMPTHKLLAISVCLSLVFTIGLHAQVVEPPSPASPAKPVPPGDTEPAPDDGLDPNVERDLTHYNLEKNKPAIQGYDPVAYFPEGGAKAAQGSDKFAFRYRGVVYHFGSAEHRDLFKKDPRRYEPAYGGWCATAMADSGKKVEISPKNFIVTGGRLFLFYKGLFQNAADDWKKDEPARTGAADGWWRSVAGEEPRVPDAGREAVPAPEPSKDAPTRR